MLVTAFVSVAAVSNSCRSALGVVVMVAMVVVVVVVVMVVA